MKTFAAIDIGSYALELKLFEMSVKNGIKQIDSVCHQIDLGTDAYVTGKIGNEKLDEMCRVLREFKDICDAMKVDDYAAYCTSAIREASNSAIILDRIRQRSGLEVSILSNSEQRFLHYKAVAYRDAEVFAEFTKDRTAILDIGGSSIQISLFEDGKLVTTQNMMLGVLRLAERMAHLNARSTQYEDILAEITDSQLSVFKKLYLKDYTIKNLILVDDYISKAGNRMNADLPSQQIDEEAVDNLLKILRKHTMSEISKILDLSEDDVTLCHISTILLKRICNISDIKTIWIPGVTLGDGMAYDYAEAHKFVNEGHDFEADIVSSAKSLSKKYMGSRKRSETLESIALGIFDATKKVHGMGRRERLLLRIATLLHDCGKFISMANLGECSYNIIMYSEIIGLSHTEREIVANVVKYNHLEYSYQDVLLHTSDLDRDACLAIAKLIAILRLANGLDRSHKQKFKDVKIALKDDELIFTINNPVDITLEKGLFYNRAEFFDEVFSIHPVIRQKVTNG
ncbi:MAG: HD domain-containing protein [Lachnospiraceae bacterium]|nr:HD domain-containing protein [Lachnospiraceae bacterium]